MDKLAAEEKSRSRSDRAMDCVKVRTDERWLNATVRDSRAIIICVRVLPGVHTAIRCQITYRQLQL